MKFVKMYLVFLCIAFLELTLAKKFRCDYNSTVEGWYKFHEMPLTYEDASIMCLLEGAQLASPTTPKLRNILEVIALGNDVKILTGIHAVSKGNFYSMDGTSLRDIPHEWSPGEPNNHGNLESCISLDNAGLFADCNCDVPLPFVCYRNKKAAGDVNNCGTHDSGYVLDNGTNKCYKFHTETVSFEKADFICSAEGGRLAIANSDREAQVLKDIFAKYPASKLRFEYYDDIRLGYFYNHKAAVWITLEGQTITQAGYDKWNTGEPNNYVGDEYCGGMTRGGYFDDVNCTGKLAFICEKSPDYPPVCEEEFCEQSFN